MTEPQNKTISDLFGNRMYFLMAIALAIPTWIGSNFYVEVIGVGEDEATATAIAITVIAALFAGRYAGLLWTDARRPVSRLLLILIGVVLFALVGWIFFHIDFPLGKRTAMNLFLFWIPFVLSAFLAGFFIKLIRASTQQQLLEARSAAANSKSELHLLQSQLSPHFLFNTLNNLYGLSITEHQKIPPLLLKLSELLRYTVYDAAETYVPLAREIEYINNYIEFEKIRIGGRLVLSTDIESLVDNDARIAPMVLIVFIENAFKHSRNSTEQHVYIDISLKIWSNRLLFTVKNSHSKAANMPLVVDRNSGFGLKNVRKRLELLYPDQHLVEIEENESSYSVLLQLRIK